MSEAILTDEAIANAREVVFDKNDNPLEVTGYLDNALKLNGLVGGFLTGNVSSDLHRRFKDGDAIHTSYVLEEIEKDVFLTRSRNVYRVRSWRVPPVEA